jgi:hypothetical protein
MTCRNIRRIPPAAPLSRTPVPDPEIKPVRLSSHRRGAGTHVVIAGQEPIE